MVSLYALAETSYYLGEWEQAKEYLHHLKKKAQETGSKIYQMLPNYYLYMIQGEEEERLAI